MSLSRTIATRLACSALAAAGSVAALLPSQAAAHSSPIRFQSFYQYTVSFTGKGSFTRTVSGEGGSTLSEEASWTWSTVYPDVLVPLTSGSPLSAAGFPAFGLGNAAGGTWKITNTGSVGEDCSNSGTLGLPPGALGSGGAGGVRVHRSGPGAGKGVVFNLLALTGYKTTSGAGNNVLPCDPEDFWHQNIEGSVSPGIKHTNPSLPDVQPLSTTIKLAPSDLRGARVTKHVSIGVAEMVPSDCGSGGGVTCTQGYTWSGSVKFTKHKLKG